MMGDVSGKNESKHLLIVLILLIVVLSTALAFLFVFLLRYKRRAQAAERECVMLSQGASTSLSTKPNTKHLENLYQTPEYRSTLPSTSSYVVDKAYQSRTSSVTLDEPIYEALKVTHDYSDYDKVTSPEVVTCKVLDDEGNNMADERKSKC